MAYIAKFLLPHALLSPVRGRFSHAWRSESLEQTIDLNPLILQFTCQDKIRCMTIGTVRSTNTDRNRIYPFSFVLIPSLSPSWCQNSTFQVAVREDEFPMSDSVWSIKQRAQLGYCVFSGEQLMHIVESSRQEYLCLIRLIHYKDFLCAVSQLQVCFTFLHIGIKLQNDWVEIFMKCKKHAWKNSTRNSGHSLALWLTKPTPMTLLTINASVTALEAVHAHSACTHSFHSDSLYSQPDRHTCSCCSCLECMSHHEDMEMKNKLQKKSKNVHGLS